MGAPVEYCRVAIATRQGWYVTPEEQHCRGGIVGMSTVETKALSIEWIEGTTEPTFVLATSRRVERGENYETGDGQYHHSTADRWARPFATDADGRACGSSSGRGAASRQRSTVPVFSEEDQGRFSF